MAKALVWNTYRILQNRLIKNKKQLIIYVLNRLPFEEKNKASFCALKYVNVNVKAFKANNITESWLVNEDFIFSANVYIGSIFRFVIKSTHLERRNRIYNLNSYYTGVRTWPLLRLRAILHLNVCSDTHIGCFHLE